MISKMLTVFVLFLAFAAYSEAVCCGRGQNGYCKDCSKVGLLRSRKCCGAGSGHGNGCNIFCCNCGGGKCIQGSARFTHIPGTGWLGIGKRYTCSQSVGDGVDDANSDLLYTKETFDGMDANKDNTLNPDEFAEGLRQHLNLDFESSYSLAADLMINMEEDNPIRLMDAAKNAYELDENQEADILSMMRNEFQKMDTNNDGIIQAKEFDRDLQ